MTPPVYVPDAGDLIWTDFDPTKGREQAGRRPALVVSPSTFTANTGAVVCPITSRVRPFPTSVVLPPGLPVAGETCTAPPRPAAPFSKKSVIPE
jgi:mRNA interferase MazF